MEVLGKIVENLDPFNRLSVRKVCRKLRDAIDSTDPGFKTVEVRVTDDMCLLWANSQSSFYSMTVSGGIIKGTKRSEKSEFTSLNGLLDELAVVLKNPRLQLDKLVIYATMEQGNIVKWFEASNPIHTKMLKLSGFELSDFIFLLSRFKPGVLEEIDISWYLHLANTPFTRNYRLTDLFEMEQWKQIIMNIPHFKSGVIWAHQSIQPEVARVFVPVYDFGYLRTSDIKEFHGDEFLLTICKEFFKVEKKNC